MVLSNKQRLFAEEYVKDFNATQAAIRANYSKQTAYSQGSRLLKNVEISAYIDAYIEESTMSGKEALLRLSRQAAGNMEEFTRVDGYGERVPDLSILDREPGKGALVKSLTVTKKRIVKQVKVAVKDEQGNWKQEKQPLEEEIITTRFELYDAQSALKEIIKLNRLDNGQATDNIKHDHHIKPKFGDLDDDDLDAFLSRFAERERRKAPPDLH